MKILKGSRTQRNWRKPSVHAGCGGFAGPTAYTVTADAGLDLTLQSTNANAADTDHPWGLHSFTLHAGEWKHAWPKGLDPTTATAHDVVRLFAPDPESSLVTPTMVCFAVPALREGQQ